METSGGVQRIEWIDVLKGIGILFVVAGHSALSPNFVEYIFSFHMPLFFFLSGYLFSSRNSRDFKAFLGKKARGLLVPYVAFGLITMGLMALIDWVVLKQPSDFVAMVRDTIISTRNSIPYNNPLWFLTALFCVEIFYYLLKKYLPSRKFLILAVVVLGLIAFPLSISPRLPWNVDSALYYMVFYGIGNWMKEESQRENGLGLNGQLLTLAVVLAGARQIWVLFEASNGSNMISVFMDFSRYFFFSVGAGVFGIGFYALAAQWIGKTRILKDGLSYLGRNSLIIMAMHYCLFYLFDLINYKTLCLPPSNGLGLVKTVVAVCLLIPLIELINRFFPYLTGRSWRRS